MLPKKNRVPRSLYPRDAKGQSRSQYFVLKVSPSLDKRAAVAVSKKVAKSAVVRNTVRRRVYSVLKNLLPSLPEGMFLMTTLPPAKMLQGKDLEIEINELFKKFTKEN